MERILIVHDGGSASGGLVELLDAQGISVQEAKGCSDARGLLNDDAPFDLVFCLTGPDDKGGIDLIQQIRRAEPRILTVLVGERSNPGLALEGIRAGAFEFLGTPIEAGELQVVLSRVRDHQMIVSEAEGYRRQLEKTIIDRDSELSMISKTLTQLHGLGPLSQAPQDPESALKGFSEFALSHFKLDTFGVFVLENDGLRKLIFTDRFHRQLDPLVLEPTSALCRAVLEKSPKLERPSTGWYLQKKNRWGRYWPLEQPGLAGLMYAGSDYDTDTPENSSRDSFRFFKHRIEGFLREHYMAQEYKQRQRRMFVSSIESHARSIEAKDTYTAGHCDRVALYSELLARQAGEFTEEWIFNLRIGAILHDIGKIGVPTALLCKPGMLSAEEQQQIQSHPVIGGRIVRTMEEFKLESAVRHHHECFDGKGYPDGLKGEAIPIEARLILAADTFDAMTSNRPYRRALSTERAIDELKKFSGRQFDPEVVRLMVEAGPALEEAHRNSSKTMNPLKDLAEAV